MTLLVQIDPAYADRTYDHFRDTLIDSVVFPKFQEAVKTVTAKYDATTQVRSRGAVQDEMLAYIQHELAGKGVIVGPGALSIINFSYNPEYQASIEASAVSQQLRVKSMNDQSVKRIEAETKVITARGDAQAQALLEKWDGRLPAVMGGGQNILDVSSLMGASGDEHARGSGR